MYYKLSDAVSGRKIDSHLLLYDADRNIEKAVNETGSQIISLFSKMTIGDLVEFFTDEYELGESQSVRSDVINFISELETGSWIVKAQTPFTPYTKQQIFPDYHDGPIEIDISVTGVCNLKCGYCFYSNAMANRPDLSSSEWLQFFDELGTLGVRRVTLSGGEVFTRKDIWQLIDSIIANGMRYSILTNGTLINAETITQFKIRKRTKRLNSVQISIDGGTAEIHDKSRGVGSFEKAVRGIKLLQAENLPVTSRLTVNRHNVDHLDDAVCFLLADLSLSSISTNDVVPLGAGCNKDHSIALSVKQQIKAIASLKRLEDKYNGRVTAQAGPLAKWHHYNEMENAKRTGAKTAKFVMGCLSACGCVNSKLAVHNDGTLSPCNMLPEFELGIINSTAIKDVWLKNSLIMEMRKRSLTKMEEVAGCQQCIWVPFCNGGCPAYPVSFTGDLHKSNERECYKAFLKASNISSVREVMG